MIVGEKHTQITQSETLTWSAGKKLQLALPKNGLITRIDIKAYITAASAVSGALSQLGLFNFIDYLTIDGGGGVSYYGMTGDWSGRMMHLANLQEFPPRSWNDIVATSQNVFWTIHFGSYPTLNGVDNPYDLSAGIPAKDETTLNLTWTCPIAATSIDDVVDISSGTMTVTCYEVLNYPLRGVMKPVSSTEQYAHTANKTNRFDVPTGAYVRRIFLLSQDEVAKNTTNGPVLANDEIDTVALELPRTNETPVSVDWQTLAFTQSKPTSMQVINAPNTAYPYGPGGFAILDLRQLSNSPWGLNLTEKNTGDVKLALKVQNYSSGDDTTIFYDMLKPHVK